MLVLFVCFCSLSSNFHHLCYLEFIGCLSSRKLITRISDLFVQYFSTDVCSSILPIAARYRKPRLHGSSYPLTRTFFQLSSASHSRNVKYLYWSIRTPDPNYTVNKCYNTLYCSTSLTRATNDHRIFLSIPIWVTRESLAISNRARRSKFVNFLH